MEKINVTFRSLLVEWLCTDKPDQYPLWFSRRKRKWGRKTPWSLDLMIRHLASFRQRPWPLNSAPTYVYHRSFFLILSWSTSANLSARWRRMERRKEGRLVCSIHDLVDLAALTFALESFAREKILRDAVSWKRRSSGRGHHVEFVSECWRVRCITHLWVLIDILRCACSPVCLLCGRQAAKNPEWKFTKSAKRGSKIV